MRKIIIIILINVYTVNLFSQTNNSSIKTEEKLFELSLIWKEVAYNFAYFDRVPYLNWNEEYLIYMKKILESKNDFDYYLLLEEFVSLLKDGHTRIIIPRTIIEEKNENFIYIPWFLFDWVNQKPHIIAVRKSMKSKVPLGSEILKINGMEFLQYVDLYLRPNTVFKQSVQTKSKISLSQLMPKQYYPMEMTIVDNLDTLNVKADSMFTGIEEWHRLYKKQDWPIMPSYSIVYNDIGYLNLAGGFNNKMVDFFDSILPKIKNNKGLLIDLRYSSGGSGDVSSKILSYFTEKDSFKQFYYTRVNNANNRAFGAYADSSVIKFIGGSLRYFDFSDYYNDLKFQKDSFFVKNLVPEERRISIPVVVLINNYVGSASEDFLIDFVNSGIGIVVGESSAGSCSQPLVFVLPSGGIVMIATQKTMLNENEVFTFIKPDVEVKRNLEEILLGKDKIFEVGLEVLKEEIRKKAK